MVLSVRQFIFENYAVEVLALSLDSAEGGIVSGVVAQVIDGLGNPLVIPMKDAVGEYSQFVSTCRSSTGFVAPPNTVITPESSCFASTLVEFPQPIKAIRSHRYPCD